EKKFEMVEIVVDQNSSLVGKTFGSIEYPLGSAIIALQERDNLISPEDDTQINVGMKLIIVAKEGFAEKIKKLLS
ncbi:MAG: TrkA C-terminal domain-containing protein, partial [archaeon]